LGAQWIVPSSFPAVALGGRSRGTTGLLAPPNDAAHGARTVPERYTTTGGNGPTASLPDGVDGSPLVVQNGLPAASGTGQRSGLSVRLARRRLRVPPRLPDR
jgi:hypothetical protein